MWTLQEHMINAAAWAIAGNYFLPSLEARVGTMAGMAILALAYSYGTDYASGYLAGGSSMMNLK